MSFISRIVPRRAAMVASFAALLAATPALADPANVIITTAPNTKAPADLAEKLSAWRQSGEVSDVIWLDADQRDNAGYGTFVQIEFPTETDYDAWARNNQPKLRRITLTLAAFAATGGALAQTLPPERATGPISIATNAQLASTLRNLAAAYARAHPGQRIRIDVAGSDVAMARLSTGRSDMAIIGRSANDQELKAYEWMHRTPPKATAVFHGSIANPGHTASLAVLVHASNPIKSITPAQLTEAFRLGGAAPTWSVLGVKGALAAHPIHLVIHNAESGTGRYMRNAMLNDEVQFDWRRTTEVTDPVDPKLGLDLSGARIAANVARNPAALGIGDARAVRGVRVVPVLIDGVAKLPGEEGYRYDRDVMSYSDPKPRPGAGAFLDWLRTPAASIIIKQGRYRPLATAR